MRVYPFGSGSVDISLIQTASQASYTELTQTARNALSASIALRGVDGPRGADGICVYESGSEGPRGFTGRNGFNGTVLGPF